MPRPKNTAGAAEGAKPAKRKNANGNGANLGFEAQLFLAADKLRKNLEPSDYKHVALGLIFLKYISNAFEAKRAALLADDPAAAEDPDEYLAENVFWVPKEARWSHLQDNAKQPTIGKLIDDAMSEIEKSNPGLKGVLPKDYNRPALDKVMLGELIDLVSGIGMGEPSDKAKDILGRVYEYFLGGFAGSEGKRGASSTRRARWCACWSKCWSRTRAVSTTRAAAPVACSCNPKSSSKATVAGSATSPSTDRRAITRRGGCAR
jgi:type I restriction enzyme M protein